MEKIVYLKRNLPFKHEAMHTEAMQEQLAQSQRSIGSFFKKGSKQPTTGLTPEEEDILIPILLQVRIDNHVEYSKAKYDHFNDIVTKIPGGKTGLPLNIGLKDNAKPVCAVLSETPTGKILNLPDNIEDFIKWRHAIAYPYTASSVESSIGDPTIQYYVEDPVRVIESNFKELEIKDNAWTEYVKAKGDPERVNMLLTVLKTFIRKQNGRPPININNLSNEEKIMTLRDVATQKPEIFYKYSTDQNLKKRYFIEELLSVGLLNKIGNTFVDASDNNTNLGDSMADVVQNLWNAKETSRLNRLKADYDGKKNKSKVLA